MTEDTDRFLAALNTSGPIGNVRVSKRITAAEATARWGSAIRGSDSPLAPLIDVTDDDGTWTPLYSGWLDWTGYGLVKREGGK